MRRIAVASFAALVVVLLTTTARGQDPLFTFQLPWDDDTHTAIDLSPWLPKPAGGRGFVRATADGHFATDSGRVRFWGTNTTFAANFPSKFAAGKVARRLAKFGVNLVRLHHLDISSAGSSGIWTTLQPDREIDPNQLDRLDYFIAQLKEQGIYTDLNLLVTRPFNRSGRDDLPAAIDAVSDLKVRAALGFFDPQVLALQKRYARDLLTHVNPYTGRAYVDEPAVALIEVNNENGLVFAYMRQQLDTLPAFFRNRLSELWTDWLRKKYVTNQALRTAWGVVEQSSGSDLLSNGSFSHSTIAPWFGEQHESAAVALTIAGDGPTGGSAVRMRITSPGTAGWHVQLNQGGLSLQAGRPYTLTFRARASAPRTISVDCGVAVSPWPGLGFTAPVSLDTSWQTFTYSFTVNQSVPNARINFSNMGLVVGDVWFTDISLRPGGRLGLYADEHLTDGSIRPFLFEGEGIARTAAGSEDWFRFLLDTEGAYWTSMREFIKTELRARPLLIGTAVSTSTPNLMAQFDAVDTHGYWYDLVFPGQPSSATDWYVTNQPMVNTPATSTVTQMALRRVANRPMVVTEYNHLAPNTFQAEAFMFLAAYGALHDFDALVSFDYTGGAPSDDTRNTFDIYGVGQNPAIMATFIPAAAAFLRGDIAPAQDLALVPISRADEAKQLVTSSAWRLVSAATAGADPMQSLNKRVAIVVDGQSSPAQNTSTRLVERPRPRSSGIELSDTSQIRWDVSVPGRGLVTVDAPGSKFAFGFLQGREVTLSGVTIRGEATLQAGFGVVAVTALDTSAIDSAQHLIVTAVGAATNTGSTWYAYPDRLVLFPPPIGTQVTLRDNWGTAPTRVEGLRATIGLPAPSGAVRVWALDSRGARTTTVPMGSAPLAQFTISPTYQAVWYEVEISRP